MYIDWNKIGEQAFNVRDPFCGFWTDSGFTPDQNKAKTYTQSSLTKEERDAIEKHQCILLSA